MNKAGAALIWAPFPNSEEARIAAQKLLEEKLIACANIVPGVESVFEWQGKVSTSQEVGVIFKTTSDKLEVVVSRLSDLHPYDTPAIFGWHSEVTPDAVSYTHLTLPTTSRV